MPASHAFWLAASALALAACSSCSSSSSGNPGFSSTSSSSSGGGSGSSSGGSSGGLDAAMEAGPSPMQACTDFATAFCSQLAKCTPFAFQANYGDMNTCVTRSSIPCPAALGANGTTMTPSDLEQCVSAVNAETCDEALDNPQPSACSIPGTIAAGAACGSDWQCTTSFCQLVPGSLCGTCTDRKMGPRAPDAGAECAVDAQCAATLVCAGGSCVSPGMMGATCSNAQECMRTLTCIGGTCKTPLAVGATCAAATDCDGSKGLYCDLKTTKTCKQTGTAMVGGACGIVSGGLVACIDGSNCANMTMGMGTCHQAAADNAPCGPGIGCMSPAVCIKSTSYSCELPNAAMCH